MRRSVLRSTRPARSHVGPLCTIVTETNLHGCPYKPLQLEQRERIDLAESQLHEVFADGGGEFETVTGESCSEHDVLVARMAVDDEVMVRRSGVEADG